MGGAQEVLSNDVEELRRTVVSLQKNVTILEEEIRFLKDRLFGSKADRWSAEDVRQTAVQRSRIGGGPVPRG